MSWTTGRIYKDTAVERGPHTSARTWRYMWKRCLIASSGRRACEPSEWKASVPLPTSTHFREPHPSAYAQKNRLPGFQPSPSARSKSFQLSLRQHLTLLNKIFAMPAEPNPPRMSICGLPLPLPSAFDYAAHHKCPADTPAPDDMELLEKNRRNVRTETHNANSISVTHDYKEAVTNTESTNTLNVGLKLKAYYAYTEEEKQLLVGSKEVVEATGPLPVFMTSWVAAQCLVVTTEVMERRRCDTDRTKAPHSIRGTLQMGTLHTVAPTSEVTITILDIWWHSLFYKIYFPLYWWVNKVIQQYHDHLHLIPKCNITLENGTKVQVINFLRAEEMLGDEDSTFNLLTPGLWRQALCNLLVAYDICCTPMAEGDSEYQANYNMEYKAHTHFFARLKCIEDLKMFPVWYLVENKLRNKIYNSSSFALTTWENRWMIALAAWKQANTPTHFTPSCSASPFNSSSSGPPNRNSKRTSPDDRNPAAVKRCECSSTPTSGEGQSFQKLPACITCCRLHSVFDHSPAVIMFIDSQPIFSVIKCNSEHGDEWLHVCSLCGGDHGALTWSSTCFVPVPAYC
ncbi:hypothetical protein DFH08DRAFT_1037833 [Mycena albidolilacea]|uniref:Uncharacterized protein n=1 Tax=Mycena albidolilacea TaxID=1033008 RepID=A0AAD7AHT3_9AGAR|nr:hypothetical protein DFH08DRAFT_1037833 [Mycena albidolilacea]